MAENRELALILKLVADQFQAELKKSGGVVGEFQKFIGDWRTQLTLAGTALFAIAKSTANFGEEALKTSQRLGLTVEKTTALQYAAHLADVPVMTLERGLQTLALRAVEAARGSGEGAKLFASLGISATDTAGKVKPLDHLFFEFQDRLKAVGNQAEFVEAGVSGLGKGFREFVPLIRQGSDATKAMMEEGRKHGVVMSRDQAEAAAKFNDELKRLDAQVNGVKLSIGNALIPTMRELIELFRTLGVGTGLGSGLQLIQHQLTMLNTLLKELQANAQFLFGTGKDALTFGQLKERIHQIEAGGAKQLFEMRHPGVLSSESGGGAGQSGGRASSIGTVSDRDVQLAKALNEIWQTGNRALEIRDRLFGEVMAKWDERAQFFVQMEEREKDANERRAAGEQALREFAEEQFRLDDEMVAHGQAAQVARGQFWVDYTKTVFKMEQDAMAESAAANRTFFDEWKIGMDKYVRDTKSGFGLGADLARRTAQTMEQAFRQSFFDLWDGKIRSMFDVLERLGDFAKQVFGTVASQLATKAALSAFGFGAGVPAFASGGAVFGPTLALVGENASRSNPEYIGHANQLGLGGGVNIQINNYSNSEVQGSDGGRGPDGNRLIYITVRNAARAAFASGDMNKTMEQTFGIRPSPGRR